MNNSVKRDWIETIVDSLKHYQRNTAFVINGESYSYKDLEDRIGRIINLLKENDEPRIGILVDDSIETYAAILALLITGKTYVVLHPSYPESRNIKVAQLAGLRTLLAKGTVDRHSQLRDMMNVVSLVNLPKSDSEEIHYTATEKDNAYIIFTSGSTGEPKGVPISHKNLNAFFNAYRQLGWKLDEQDRMLQMFELTFDVSVVSMLYPLTIGAAIYTVGYKEVKHFKAFEILEQEKITFATITPSLLQLLSPYFDEIYLPNLRYLGLSAEASQSELLERFRSSAPHAEFVNLYGPTEATIYCTSYRIPKEGTCKHHNGMVAIGKPFDGIETKICDMQGTEVSQGEMGELWVSGDQVMEGYLNDPERSEKVIVKRNGKRYYRTGDLCILDNDGTIIYCGRMDYQIKIQGFRIELSEIEYAAKNFFNNDCNAVALPVKVQGICNELLLVVEKNEGDKRKLQLYLEHQLPKYMLPKDILFMSHFPTTNSNKVDRKRISEQIKMLQS